MNKTLVVTARELRENADPAPPSRESLGHDVDAHICALHAGDGGVRFAKLRLERFDTPSERLGFVTESHDEV